MKSIFMITCFALFAGIISCSKTSKPSNELSGKWNLVNDSLSVIGLAGNNYVGTENDYYNFTNEGTLYIQEDSLRYTKTYSIGQNNQVDISYTPLMVMTTHQTYDITNLTTHTATLTLSAISPGPAERQIINLRK